MRYNKKKIYKSYCLTKKSARWIIKYCLECFNRKQNLKKKLIHCSSDFAVSPFLYEPYLVLQYKVRMVFFSIKVYLLDIFVFGTTFTHDNKHQSISNSTTQTPIKQDFYFFFRYADIRINFKSCIFSICRFLLSQSLFFFSKLLNWLYSPCCKNVVNGGYYIYVLFKMFNKLNDYLEFFEILCMGHCIQVIVKVYASLVKWVMWFMTSFISTRVCTITK